MHTYIYIYTHNTPCLYIHILVTGGCTQKPIHEGLKFRGLSHQHGASPESSTGEVADRSCKLCINNLAPIGLSSLSN